MALTHDQVVTLLKEGSNPDPNVLLDDGEFSIEHNENYPLDRGNGFLHRICRVTMCTPGGYAVLGSYERRFDGKWSADLVAEYDGINDSSSVRELGIHPTRDDAIAALWLARADAFFAQH